jgi:hypothetical protein
MNVNSGEMNNLDNFIEQLTQCKPLKETEVKFLCEKVLQIPKNMLKNRQKKYSVKKVMFKVLELLSQSVVIFMVNFMI